MKVLSSIFKLILSESRRQILKIYDTPQIPVQIFASVQPFQASSHNLNQSLFKCQKVRAVFATLNFLRDLQIGSVSYKNVTLHRLEWLAS